MNPPSQPAGSNIMAIIGVALGFGLLAWMVWDSNLNLFRKDRSMAGGNVLEFTSDNWQKEVSQSDIPVVVDFWAPWCGPCRQLTPTIDKLATSYSGRVKVGKLNVDDANDIAAKYGVTSIPRVFIFKGGDKPRRSIVGLVSEADLAKAIDGVLQEN